MKPKRSGLLFILIWLLFLGSCKTSRAPVNMLDNSAYKGSWTSTTDANYSLIFFDSLMEARYKKHPTDTFHYQILNRSCDTNYYHGHSEKVIFLRETNKEGQEFCYEVVSEGGKHLTLIYSINGGILTFRRK